MRERRKKSRPVQRPVRPAPTPGRLSLARSTGANRRSTSDNKIVNQENKNSADIITWREYEALRNEMRREFRTKDDELKSTVDEIKQTLDATNVTVTGLSDQMTDIQRNIADMRLAIENLTAQQQQQQEDDEDPELEDDAHNARGAPRGHRPRGWVPLGRNGRGQDEEDGLGKPKFSIPKFEGGADVEEYLTWELKIEKLWSLHPHYSEDRKIKLASSEFDGYALRWWDSLVRNLDEDGAQPIRTWRAMKEAMTSRFVPTNYMRNIFDKLTLLRQGVKTVDEYYMEMEMLMQRGRVRESLEMTMQRFLNGLKYDVKGIVRHYTYTNMNQLLHHAREAESQLAEEAKVKGRATGAGRFTPRAPSTAPAPSTRSAPYSTPPSKPVSNVSNAKKSESAASTSGSSMSTTRNRDMLCHTCGGKGHFKRDCPNRKVMFINEDNEYETGDDVDPNAPDDDDYDTDGEDAYPSDARTIVVSQRALNVLPSASTQRCNLFQTKALVGPDKACKVIIDGGSCRNLASKELCTKLKLKYLPHPHPYYIQWLSDNGEMKVTHSGTPGGTSSATSTSTPTSEMAEEQITYEDLPPDHKKKYDELKAICEAELIGSFEKTRSHGIRFKGFTPQGVLEGVDLSLPSQERTRALRQEINYVVAHSLHRHSESLVNTLERVALRVVQEIMERRYSPSGPVLGTHQGEVQLHTRPPLPYAMAAPRQQDQCDLRDQFGILPKKKIIGYSKPYPNEFDLIPLPPKYRLPDFNKFNGSEGSSSIEHVRQKRGETVSEYIQRFRTVKNRCYSVHLTEKEAVELAVAGLAASFKDLTFQVEYNSLTHLVNRLTLYEQRHPELYQDKFKRAISLVNTDEDEDSAEDQEVAVAEWTRTAVPVSCKWVNPPGPPRGFDFDVTKAEQIFDLLLKEKQLKLPEGHKIPTAQEMKKRPYCKWHHTFTHATNDCKVLRAQIQMVIESGD
ncbi:hypothetical protein QYE76_059425 [Lolium multiflorum]|uniref:CCHC-type domain-containing protein n=1 Tax=Lolium multiflorum TaxID=4521 RepID=A0AAD8RY23_LOLMU|nr:hypothetical protein QYE76_059425 [Lolium multiflorum]